MLEKKTEGHTLPLMEAFYTIQGEGFHQGKAAYFIRLGGCDVGCHWCDVKDSWQEDRFPRLTVDQIVSQAREFPAPIVVITGGEPLMHDLVELTSNLKQHQFKTHIETSGAHPLTGNWDWICFSPKKFKPPVPEIYHQAHELKVVIYNQHDFEWATTFQEKVNKECKLYLQPEWSKADTITPKIIEFVKKHPEWNISLQIHKYMDIP
ncbi:MAG: 7-carboxy-7-deazaguanine synthase QueE [Candidatus Cyclobacteriaceae bacterium M3_2C_046]